MRNKGNKDDPATCLKNTRSPDRARSLAPHWEALNRLPFVLSFGILGQLLGLFAPHRVLDDCDHLLIHGPVIGLRECHEPIMQFVRDADRQFLHITLCRHSAVTYSIPHMSRGVIFDMIKDELTFLNDGEKRGLFACEIQLTFFL